MSIKYVDFFTLSLLLLLKWDLNKYGMQNLTPFIHIACLQSKWLENTLYIQEVITFLGDKNIFHETTAANNSNSNRVALVCMEEIITYLVRI